MRHLAWRKREKKRKERFQSTQVKIDEERAWEGDGERDAMEVKEVEKKGKNDDSLGWKRFGWREAYIAMKLQISMLDCWSNSRRKSPWLWASIKSKLNEFRVAVWHCINISWHLWRHRNDCEQMKHLYPELLMHKGWRSTPISTCVIGAAL